jgi:hypothetical protein
MSGHIAMSNELKELRDTWLDLTKSLKKRHDQRAKILVDGLILRMNDNDTDDEVMTIRLESDTALTTAIQMGNVYVAKRIMDAYIRRSPNKDISNWVHENIMDISRQWTRSMEPLMVQWLIQRELLDAYQLISQSVLSSFIKNAKNMDTLHLLRRSFQFQRAVQEKYEMSMGAYILYYVMDTHDNSALLADKSPFRVLMYDYEVPYNTTVLAKLVRCERLDDIRFACRFGYAFVGKERSSRSSSTFRNTPQEKKQEWSSDFFGVHLQKEQAQEVQKELKSLRKQQNMRADKSRDTNGPLSTLPELSGNKYFANEKCVELLEKRSKNCYHGEFLPWSNECTQALVNAALNGALQLVQYCMQRFSQDTLSTDKLDIDSFFTELVRYARTRKALPIIRHMVQHYARDLSLYHSLSVAVHVDVIDCILNALNKEVHYHTEEKDTNDDGETLRKMGVYLSLALYNAVERNDASSIRRLVENGAHADDNYRNHLMIATYAAYVESIKALIGGPECYGEKFDDNCSAFLTQVSRVPTTRLCQHPLINVFHASLPGDYHVPTDSKSDIKSSALFLLGKMTKSTLATRQVNCPAFEPPRLQVLPPSVFSDKKKERVKKIKDYAHSKKEDDSEDDDSTTTLSQESFSSTDEKSTVTNRCDVFSLPYTGTEETENLITVVLLYAVARNQTEIVQAILDEETARNHALPFVDTSDINVNCLDDMALQYACYYNNLSMTRTILLCDQNKKPNTLANDGAPLAYAIQRNDNDLVHLLLDHTPTKECFPDCVWTALLHTDNTFIINLLLQREEFDKNRYLSITQESEEDFLATNSEDKFQQSVGFSTVVDTHPLLRRLFMHNIYRENWTIVNELREEHEEIDKNFAYVYEENENNDSPSWSLWEQAVAEKKWTYVRKLSPLMAIQNDTAGDKRKASLLLCLMYESIKESRSVVSLSFFHWMVRHNVSSYFHVLSKNAFGSLLDDLYYACDQHSQYVYICNQLPLNQHWHSEEICTASNISEALKVLYGRVPRKTYDYMRQLLSDVPLLDHTPEEKTETSNHEKALREEETELPGPFSSFYKSSQNAPGGTFGEYRSVTSPRKIPPRHCQQTASFRSDYTHPSRRRLSVHAENSVEPSADQGSTFSSFVTAASSVMDCDSAKR